MDKKLPSVFANKIDKKLSNNETVYYAGKESVPEEEVRSTPVFGNRVSDKIRTIFNSKSYIYKADVVITTKSGKVTKQIVGRNQKQLITIENDIIPIDEIIDIELKK